jgi:hypothetical protein
MEQQTTAPERWGALELNGKTAVVLSGQRVVTVSRDTPLAGVEELIVPADVDTLYGINRFDDLRVLRYAGSADLLGLQESLHWLGEKGNDNYQFLNRVSTNLLAFRPIAETLVAIDAPNMMPIQGLPAWPGLMALLEDSINPNCGFYRQDDSRQNAILCNTYAQLKRLEWVFAMGHSMTGARSPAEIERAYPAEDRLTAEEQIYYAIALMQGHSYRDFYSIEGEHSYVHLKTKAAYVKYLRDIPAWNNTEKFEKMLRRMIALGLITDGNRQAALDLLVSHGLTEATAILLNNGGRPPAADDLSFLDEEFSL